jgi:hypothetical protein
MSRVGDEIGPCLSLEELARNGLAGRGGSRWASGRPEDCDGQWRLPGKGLDHAELGLFRPTQWGRVLLRHSKGA